MKTELAKLINGLAQKISEKYYPTRLLILTKKENYSNSRLLISAGTLKNNLSTISQVYKELLKILTNEESRTFSEIGIVETNSDFFIELNNYLENNGNPDELYNLELGGLKINRALVIISPVDSSKKYIQETDLINFEKRLQQVLVQWEQYLKANYVTRKELEEWTKNERSNSLSFEKLNLLNFDSLDRLSIEKTNK